MEYDPYNEIAIQILFLDRHLKKILYKLEQCPYVNAKKQKFLKDVIYKLEIIGQLIDQLLILSNFKETQV